MTVSEYMLAMRRIGALSDAGQAGISLAAAQRHLALSHRNATSTGGEPLLEFQAFCEAFVRVVEDLGSRRAAPVGSTNTGGSGRTSDADARVQVFPIAGDGDGDGDDEDSGGDGGGTAQESAAAVGNADEAQIEARATAIRDALEWFFNAHPLPMRLKVV